MSIVAVGGAKGGTGRSVVAAGIAVFFAQLGKRVLIVDGHPNAPQLATAFGCAPPPLAMAPWADPAVEPRGRDTIVPNVRLLSTYGETGTLTGVSLKRPREIAAHSGADHVVLDLGAGSQSALLDAMLDVDAAVLVALPEPSSVEAIYRWIRHAFARSLSHALKSSPPALAAMRATLDREGAPPAPIDLARVVARAEPSIGPIVWESLHSLRPWLVVNASRSRVDLELGNAMTHLAKQRLGVDLQFLGHVEYDEAVSLAARKRKPLLLDAPGAKAARNLERLARKLSATLSGAEPGAERSKPMPVEPSPATHYDTLLVDRGVTDEEIRRAVRRMRERYATDSLASAGLCSLDDRENALARIEEARDVLLDPVRRRPYDLSISPPERSASIGAIEPMHSEPEPVELPPMPELTPESEFSGSLLRAVREARGVDLRELSSRTKIPLTSLRAIEEELYESLPPAVYLRGFVSEIARQLKLDVDQVARSYLRRARERGMP
jgi:flagellar biosynthesis protein FlhG